MIFEYAHSLDRSYQPVITTSTGLPSPSEEDIERPIMATSEIGKTVIDGQQGPFRQTVQAAAREGLSKIELQPGQGGGGPGGIESYGREAREELAEISRAQGVEITSVHASPQLVGNVSGLGREGFSEGERERAVNEVKRAIEFAADAAGGGSVVYHTGEFPRPMFHKYKEFEAYPGEEEKATWHLVDPKTGQVIKSVREDEEVWVPKYKANPDGTPVFLKDEQGKVLTDDYGDKIRVIETDEKGNIQVKKEVFHEFRQRPDFRDDPENAAKEFFKMQQAAEREHVLGQAKEYEIMYKHAVERRQRLLDALEHYKKALKDVPEEEMWKHAVILPDARTYGNLVPPDIKNPIKYLTEQVWENEKTIAYGEQVALSGRKNAELITKRMHDVQSISEYGKEKSVQSAAQLGKFAHGLTKERKLKKNLYITPENIFPEMGYGSHPEELITYVQDARKKMTKDLVKQGYGETEAKQAAKDHIKATFDTSHLGMWYRHFKPKEGETEEKRLKRFNKWYMGQVKKMEEAGIIGNIHIVDTFGRSHDHIVAGQGIMPVVDAVEYLKKKGYKGSMSSEASADLQNIATGTWAAFGAPIYKMGQRPAPKGHNWTDVQHSYFGYHQAPRYVFGDWAPSPEYRGAPMWSGIPLE